MDKPYYTKAQVDAIIDKLKKEVQTPNNSNKIISTQPPSGVAQEGTEWIMYKP